MNISPALQGFFMPGMAVLSDHMDVKELLCRDIIDGTE
jgi:hypothetical protein